MQKQKPIPVSGYEAAIALMESMPELAEKVRLETSSNGDKMLTQPREVVYPPGPVEPLNQTLESTEDFTRNIKQSVQSETVNGDEADTTKTTQTTVQVLTIFLILLPS